MELNLTPSIFLISIRICEVFNLSWSVILLLNSHPYLLYLFAVLLRLVLCRDIPEYFIHFWLFLISELVGFTSRSTSSSVGRQFYCSHLWPTCVVANGILKCQSKRQTGQPGLTHCGQQWHWPTVTQANSEWSGKMQGKHTTVFLHKSLSASNCLLLGDILKQKLAHGTD